MTHHFPNSRPKIRSMSQSQNKEETEPSVTPDETANTGFGEMFTQGTIEQQQEREMAVLRFHWK